MKTGEVTDMFSYYQLPSTVVDHPRYKSLKAAYSFYNVAGKTSLKELLNDALVVARDVSIFFAVFSYFAALRWSVTAKLNVNL